MTLSFSRTLNVSCPHSVSIHVIILWWSWEILASQMRVIKVSVWETFWPWVQSVFLAVSYGLKQSLNPPPPPPPPPHHHHHPTIFLEPVVNTSRDLSFLSAIELYALDSFFKVTKELPLKNWNMAWTGGLVWIKPCLVSICQLGQSREQIKFCELGPHF